MNSIGDRYGERKRILYLYQYLLQHSDQEHPESTVNLARMLAQEYGIKTARNTISNDLTMLVNSGLHIEVTRSTQNLYYYDGSLFELPELKVLIDAISAAKFIPSRKSEELINKVMSLTTREMPRSCAGMCRWKAGERARINVAITL